MSIGENVIFTNALWLAGYIKGLEDCIDCNGDLKCLRSMYNKYEKYSVQKMNSKGTTNISVCIGYVSAIRDIIEEYTIALQTFKNIKDTDEIWKNVIVPTIEDTIDAYIEKFGDML